MRDRIASTFRPVRRAVLARRRLLAAALTAVAVAAGVHAVAAPPPAKVSVLVAARDLPAVTDVRLVGPALTEGYPGLAAVPVRLPDAGMAGLLRVGDRIDLVSADPQGRSAETIADGVPVLALPDTPTEVGATGLTGRLVVVGTGPGEVTRI